MGKKVERKYAGILTASQEAALAAVPVEQQATLIKTWTEFNKKAEAQRVINRNQFGLSVNENGNVVIRGLGNRFPVGMRPDSLQKLVDNIEQIKSFLATLPKA